MLDPNAARLDGIECLREAIMTVPIPGAPPRLSKDGAAVGLAFLDIALRQNHIRRLTERLTLIEHRTARCTTEVDVSLGMLDHSQREAGLLYQHVRTRGAYDPPTAPGQDDGVGAGAAGNVMWVPISLARRGHTPVHVVDGDGTKLPRLTQYETSRLLASAMYRLFRLILLSHPDVGERGNSLHDFLFRIDKPRWLVQAALFTLLTERNKPAATTSNNRRTPDTVDGLDTRYRRKALDIFDHYTSSLQEYVGLLDLAVNDYLLVVALDAGQDEHLLAFDSPLHVRYQSPRTMLQPFRTASGAYWVQYRTRLPANLRAYHLVAETEPGLEIDTMCLSSDADRPIVKGLSGDLATLSERVREERNAPTGRPGEKKVELELQSGLRRLSELLRRRRWEASKAGIRLAGSELRAAQDLVHAATSGEAKPSRGGADNSLYHHDLVTPERLERAAEEIRKQELHHDLSVETEPASQRAHVYWRRDPSRVDSRHTILISADMFIRDNSGSSATSIIKFVLSVAGISYLIGCLRFGSPFPFFGSGGMRGPTEADAIIAVLLLAPGFLYTRLDLPERQSIAGQLRKLPRLLAQVSIGTAAVLAATFAATENASLIRTALALAVAVPIMSVFLMLVMSRVVKRDMHPITSNLPAWARTGALKAPDVGWQSRFAGWWWRRRGAVADAAFSTTNVQSANPRESAS